jgi:PAS domain-containing protein
MSKDRASVAGVPVGLIAFCLTIVAIMWAALIFDTDRSKQRAMDQAGSDASNLAMAFRENVKGTINAIDQLMTAIIADSSEFGKQYQIPAWVENSPLLRGTSVQISIIGPHGGTIASTPGPPGSVDSSDRPYFRYHLDLAAPQPYIGVPVIGRDAGQWSIEVTRRIPLNDGSFGGVIVVSIDPLHFTQFFDDVELGPNGVVDLIGRDGVVRARRAGNSQEIGQNVGGTALFRRMQHSSAGNEIIRSKIDGITRAYGYSSVPDYPLVVAVGLATDDVLAPARRQQTLYFTVGGILTFVIVTLSWFLARETRRRHQREAASLAEEKVREQKILLDTALNNMWHGLVMFDASGRAVVVNGSYVEMYRLSPETAKPGCTIRTLLEQRTASGTFAGNIDDYIETQFIRNRVTDGIFDIPDGRSIRIANRFMANGGWVSIHEDVTQRRKVEAALEKALAEAERAEREASAAHSRLRDAFEVVPEGLALFDPEDRYIMWNSRYAELYKRSANAIQVGRRFEDALRAGLTSGMYPEAKGREEEWLAERLAYHAQANSTHEQRMPDNG